VRAGDVYGYLGPNGAGKTTSMRMLLGLIRPDAGSVRLFGRDPLREGARALEGVAGFVEAPRFYPYLSGRKNLEMMADYDGGDARRRVDAALDTVDLADRARHKAGGYSHGMRQRLGIAAALLQPRELLVLDEPTNGLDPQGTREVRALVSVLAADGVTVLLSSHLLSEVEQVCTHVGVMHVGRLVAQGTLAELRQGRAPRARVETTEPAHAIRVLAARGLSDVDTDGRTVSALLGSVTPEDVLAALVRAGVPVRQFTVDAPGLEDVFVSLTGEGFDVSG
jgi:ABC-type multidrug transport system ATPase subunit